MTVLGVEQLGKRASGALGIQVDFLRDWRCAASRLNAGNHRTLFQHIDWLAAWYEGFRSPSPLIAVISDAATGRDIALVPLICRPKGGIRIVEFADLGLSDNNAPILSSAAPDDATGARAVGRALLAALRGLPEGADLLRLKKMPATIGAKPNPLAALGRIGSCSVNGNLVVTGEDFDAYKAAIKRMQLPRCWRVFSRHPGAQFRIAATVDEALILLDTMDAQQHERMRRLGLPFVLDELCHARFYRDVVRRGIADGYAVVSALVCDDGIVATSLGIRQGEHYSLLRTSNAGKPWSNCSAGLLVVERTMAALHAQGVRQFDLSIGNYDYKRRFRARPLPLTDVSIALSWRGIPYALRDRAAQHLRRHPLFARFAARALRRRIA